MRAVEVGATGVLRRLGFDRLAERAPERPGGGGPVGTWQKGPRTLTNGGTLPYARPVSINSPRTLPGPSITVRMSSSAVWDLRERLIREFDGWLPERVVDGVLRGYLDRYGVTTEEPTSTTLLAVARATSVALKARLSSGPAATAS